MTKLLAVARAIINYCPFCTPPGGAEAKRCRASHHDQLRAAIADAEIDEQQIATLTAEREKYRQMANANATSAVFLAEQLATLKADLIAGCRCVCHQYTQHGRLQDALEALKWHQEKLQALQGACEQLQQVVHRYAKHPASCLKGIGIGYYQPPSDATCNCGIDDALLTTPPVPSELIK